MAGIWGKIIGGAAGFAIGGPLGALLGAVAGHAVDRMGAAASGDGADAARQTAFTVAVIALSAKMAKTDGRVTRDEIAAFRQLFDIPPELRRDVGRVFDRARRDAGGFEPHARQIARMFADNPAVLEELLGALFHIARADGVVHPAELDYLASVARIFGLDQAAFDRVRAARGDDGGGGDPYAILGVDRDDGDEAVRAAWRRLTRENHPDRLIAQGMPEDLVEGATERMARINAAWDRVRKERGLK